MAPADAIKEETQIRHLRDFLKLEAIPVIWPFYEHVMYVC